MNYKRNWKNKYPTSVVLTTEQKEDKQAHKELQTGGKRLNRQKKGQKTDKGGRNNIKEKKRNLIEESRRKKERLTRRCTISRTKMGI